MQTHVAAWMLFLNQRLAHTTCFLVSFYLAEVPPLVSRRVLEILTHLSRHLGANASLLTYLPPPPNILGNEEKEKGKAKLIDYSTGSTSEGEIPLITLLKLLNQPLYSRSSAHLDQVWCSYLSNLNPHECIYQVLSIGISEPADGTA